MSAALRVRVMGMSGVESVLQAVNAHLGSNFLAAVSAARRAARVVDPLRGPREYTRKPRFSRRETLLH
ncbi:MAG TPA: hypothetical protein VMI54_05405 [Polyangiaceae bacterium]|nr:hypothetical protein [Polyangiaceae bacterium]